MRGGVFRAWPAALFSLAFLAAAAGGAGEGPRSSSAEEWKAEIARRDSAVREEERRLLALKKEVEEKIAKYEALLLRIEQAEGAKKEARAARLDRLVRIFEAMAPAEAAERLSSLDEATAAGIVGRMKERKAAPILAAMPPARAAALARTLAGDGKNIPSK